MKHIIFDFDGVLADTYHFHIKKINEHFDIGLTGQEYKDLHNGNFYATPLKKMKRFNSETYPHLVSEEQGLLPIADGVKELLLDLSKEKRLHIISSGFEKQIVPFLKNHDIEKFFNEKLFADHGKSKSEKFKKLFETEQTTASECLFITDTLGDIKEAQHVSLPTIAVTFGFHDRDTLLTEEPEYIADSWKEVSKYINTHFNKKAL